MTEKYLEVENWLDELIKLYDEEYDALCSLNIELLESLQEQKSILLTNIHHSIPDLNSKFDENNQLKEFKSDIYIKEIYYLNSMREILN